MSKYFKTMKNKGILIKRIRQIYGLSQSEFVKSLKPYNISQAYLAYIENGRKPLPFDLKIAIYNKYAKTLNSEIDKIKNDFKILESFFE